jgi:glycerophosphoryl diester phosphodiesterase
VIELRRPPGRFARVGHRGAPALAPENTLRSLELAIAHGCDALELDVVPLADGTLVLSHSDDLGAVAGRFGSRSLVDLRTVAPALPTLDDALEFLGTRFPEVAVQVDVKRPGYEEEVVAALQRHGALDRAFASSVHASTLRRLRELAPDLPRAYTFPRERGGITDRGRLAPALERGAALLRATLPARLPRLLARTGATAFTLHRWVCSRRAIERAHSLGAAVYVWTVDDPESAGRFAKAGADGIITNDPRIFSLLET